MFVEWIAVITKEQVALFVVFCAVVALTHQEIYWCLFASKAKRQELAAKIFAAEAQRQKYMHESSERAMDDEMDRQFGHTVRYVIGSEILDKIHAELTVEYNKISSKKYAKDHPDEVVPKSTEPSSNPRPLFLQVVELMKRNRGG